MIEPGSGTVDKLEHQFITPPKYPLGKELSITKDRHLGDEVTAKVSIGAAVALPVMKLIKLGDGVTVEYGGLLITEVLIVLDEIKLTKHYFVLADSEQNELSFIKETEDTTITEPVVEIIPIS